MKKLFSEKFLLGTAVTALFLAVQIAGMKGIGLTDDVDFYARASLRYSEWFGRAADGVSHLNFDAFSRQVVDQYWGENREHPPFAKIVMGCTHAIFTNLLGMTNTIDGLRLGVIFLATLLALFLFLLAYSEIGRSAAVFAPLALLTMPRFYFDSHAETLDVPVAATFFLSFFAFWKARFSWKWAIVAGVAFGCALSTKLNAPFLFAMLVIWWAVKNAPSFSWASGRGLRVPEIPLWLPAILVIGLAVFFLMWPWIWFDTRQRLNDYLGFHMKHYGILFSYFGTIYEKPFAPWHAPWVMAGITTPVVTILAALFGAGIAAVRTIKKPAPEDLRANNMRDLSELTLLACLFTIGPVSFLGSPKYGGVKLFLPFFPFIALLGGIAVQWVVDRVIKTVHLSAKSAAGAVVCFAVPVVLVAPSAASLARIHPYELSYYNMLIGGTPGAADAGMERQYYDIFYRPLVDWMNHHLPRGSTVTFLPNNKEYVRSAPWYKRDKILREDIQITDLNQARFLVLTHEERWPEWPSLRDRYANHTKVHEISVEGLPILTVYRLR